MTAKPKAKVKPKQAKQTPKPAPKVMGRPIKTKNIDMDELKILILKGFTDGEISIFYKIHRRTYYRWLADHPDFCHTIKAWETEASQRVKRSLYESACGWSHEEEIIHYDSVKGKFMRTTTVKQYAPNATSLAIWLTNKCKSEFTRQPEPEQDDRFLNARLRFDGVPTERNPKSDKEFAKFYDQN